MCHQVECRRKCVKTVHTNFCSNKAGHKTPTCISLFTELIICFKCILQSRTILTNVNTISFADNIFKKLSETLKTKNFVYYSIYTSWDTSLSVKETKFPPKKYYPSANSVCTRFYHDSMTQFMNPIKEDSQNSYSAAKIVSFCEHNYLL